jgi:hypothetical protein
MPEGKDAGEQGPTGPERRRPLLGSAPRHVTPRRPSTARDARDDPPEERDPLSDRDAPLQRGNIIQTLERPDEAVDTTFASIVRDPRHRGVFTLLRERIDERAFPDWTMGFRHPSHEEIGEIDGFASFLQQPAGRDLGDAAGSAYQLLRLFKENMR